MNTNYHFEWRVAYISDGSIEELFDRTEDEADAWINAIDAGNVPGIEPGDCFKQYRRVVSYAGPWMSMPR